jgi:hypothetical protein
MNNPWIWRAVVIILAIGFVPLIVSGIGSLVASGVNAVTHSVSSFFTSISGSESARTEAVIKLAVSLVVVTLIAKGLFGKRPG